MPGTQPQPSSDPDAVFAGLAPAVLLGLCIYGEARGEPVEGKVAVACVVRNRAAAKNGDYRLVILAPRQFSCFNIGDRNRPILEGLAQHFDVQNDPPLRECAWVAEGTVRGYLRDNTGGANHYLTAALFDDPTQRPPWANPIGVTARVGRHVFLRVA